MLLTALTMLEVDWPDSGEPAVVTALRGWLGSWRGLGHVAYGMYAQGFDLELKEFPHGWSATFYSTGIAHFIVQGSGWDVAPWTAVQKAALETLTRGSRRRHRLLKKSRRSSGIATEASCSGEL